MAHEMIEDVFEIAIEFCELESPATRHEVGITIHLLAHRFGILNAQIMPMASCSGSAQSHEHYRNESLRCFARSHRWRHCSLSFQQRSANYALRGRGQDGIIRRMPCDSRIVGKTLGPFAYEVDPFWTMAYAAGIGDSNPRYLDSMGTGQLIAHPVFPVCLATRARWQMEPMFLARGPDAGRIDSQRACDAGHDSAIASIRPPEKLIGNRDGDRLGAAACREPICSPTTTLRDAKGAPSFDDQLGPAMAWRRYDGAGMAVAAQSLYHALPTDGPNRAQLSHSRSPPPRRLSTRHARGPTTR